VCARALAVDEKIFGKAFGKSLPAKPLSGFFNIYHDYQSLNH